MKELKTGDKVTVDGNEYTIKEIDCQGLTFTVKAESVEDQARASLKEGWTFVGFGREENTQGLSPFVALFESNKRWDFSSWSGSMVSRFYAVRNDAPDEIWQRFGIERNPHKTEKRWWFDTGGKSVFQSDEKFCGDVIEVTAEYAEYLRNKPDGEWELRKPTEKGDQYVNMYNGNIEYAYSCSAPKNGLDIGPQDRGYRWCKPRKVAGWVEYPIEAVNGIYCVIGLNGGKWRLDKAANRVGFGGVQFDRGINQDRWFMITTKLADNDGLYESGLDCETRLIPAVPVRARFWEVKK